MHPNPDGLFDPEAIDEEAGRAWTPVKVMERKTSTVAFLEFGVAILAIAGLLTMSLTNEKWYLDMCYAFTCCEKATGGGCVSLEEHKLRSVVARQRSAKEEDAESRNRYGMVSLTYFPPTAKVTVKQIVYEQDGLDGAAVKVAERSYPVGARCDIVRQGCSDEKPCKRKGFTCQAMPDKTKRCVKRDPTVCVPANRAVAQRKKLLEAARLKGLDKQAANAEADKQLDAWKLTEGNSRCQASGYCKNPTKLLIEGESVTALPIMNIPLFEATKFTDKAQPQRYGRVDKVRTYAYQLEFKLEGYKPGFQEWKRFRRNNTHPWKQAAGIYVRPWSGLDLVPSLATLRKNYATFKKALQCYLVQKQLMIQTYDDLVAPHDAVVEKLWLKARFKSREQLENDEKTLTRGAMNVQWWQTEWARIQAEVAKECIPEKGAKKKGKKGKK